MGTSAIIAGRETLEASLLIGFLLSYLTQTGNRRYFINVWIGVSLAIVSSLVLGAALIWTEGHFTGKVSEVFEGTVMWTAAGFLTYFLWWMGRQSKQLNNSLRGRMETALTAGSAAAVGTLAFLSVFREGAETMLYLAATAADSSAFSVSIGAGLGFVLAATAGYLIYNGGTRYLNIRLFFKVTTIVLLVFAAGMVGRATLSFQAAGIFPGTIPAWNMSGLLPETHGPGAFLRALVGYTATPSLLQVIFWMAYIALVGALSMGTRLGVYAVEEPYSPIGKSYDNTLYRILRIPSLTTVIPIIMGIGMLFLLAVAFLGLNVGPFNNQGTLHLGLFKSGEDGNNLFNFALWIVWLPLLSVATILLGRVWCGTFCPLRLVADIGRSIRDKLSGRGSPVSPYLRIGWILPTSFILITFFVKWGPVQAVALYGALMFLIIFGLAFVVGLLFRRGTWCRYVCPVGGWLARITRLSPLALRSDANVCLTCKDKPCLTGTAIAGRCPSFLNPSKLESNRNCLKCWNCVVNCPHEKASMKLGWRFPGAELLKPHAPDLWESVFVASLVGMYTAVGHRSPALSSIPWPLLFFGMIALATVTYIALCAMVAPLSNISFKKALTVLGYIFLPLEWSVAVISFGDDALEFLGVVQPAASILLGVGFVWSVVLGVSILRSQSKGPLRAIASAVPVGVFLIVFLFIWLHWYASGAVIDLT